MPRLTHERELTDAVDLCRADGRHLNPDARGWSRRPLHRANLRGRWGRTKRWDYWAILTEDLVVSVTYADVDYLGLAVVGWEDLARRATGGRTVTVPLARGIALAEVSGERPLRHRSAHLDLELSDSGAGTRLRAAWDEPDGTPGRLDATVALPDGHESLNVVIPWSDTRFQFTSKHQARPVTGTVAVGDRQTTFRTGAAWGVLDVGRGRWPYRTRWNWAGGAGPSADGARLVGVQLGGKWTDGTGATENGILLDGRLVKIGADLEWRYDWDRPLDPWRVRGEDIGLDLTLHPVHDRHQRTDALVLRTEVHQVFGHWTGTVPDGAGSEIAVDGILGFAEESRSRW